MSTHTRQSTVYDYTSLRLHPDGRRVQQTSRNLNPRVSAVVQDIRGNWIAKDAGGLFAVPKTKVQQNKSVKWSHDIGSGENEEGEEFPDDGQVAGNGIGEEGSKKRKSKRVDVRPLKRRKFAQDYTFLDHGAPASQTTFLPDPTHEFASSSDDVHLAPLAPPSSVPTSLRTSLLRALNQLLRQELLKCIHHFAAMYYGERGQLLNASKEYRQHAMERRKQRQAEKQSMEEGESHGTGDPLPGQIRHYDSEEEEDVEKDEPLLDELDDQDDDNDREEQEERSEKFKTVKKRMKIRGRRKAKNRHRLDMYRAFDGSALMVIGMLVQEHIVRMLAPRIPDGWEAEMREAYENGVGEDDYEDVYPGMIGEGDEDPEDMGSGMEASDTEGEMREDVSHEMEDDERGEEGQYKEGQYEEEEDNRDGKEDKDEWDDDEEEVARQALAAYETDREEETPPPIPPIDDEGAVCQGSRSPGQLSFDDEGYDNLEE